MSDYGDLKPWVGHILRLLVQNHTKVLWNRQWRDQMGVGPQQWLCSRQSVVIGLKPRFFNSEWPRVRGAVQTAREASRGCSAAPVAHGAAYALHASHCVRRVPCPLLRTCCT